MNTMEVRGWLKAQAPHRAEIQRLVEEAQEGKRICEEELRIHRKIVNQIDDFLISKGVF